jgi:Penicillin amidase
MAIRLLGKSFLFAVVGLVSLTASTVSGVPPIAITRDNFGVPTIYNGEFSEICRAIGQVYAQDRLWQMFEVNAIANGRAAQFINPAFLPSDVFQRQINPTDLEVQEQISKFFTEQTLIAFKNYVKGLNDQVATVNANPSILPYELFALGFHPPLAPVPEFTLYDILRTARFFFQQFSRSQIPEYQLNNLSFLQTIGARLNAASAYGMLNDLDPLSSLIDSQTLMVPSHECKGFNRKEVQNFVIPGTFENLDLTHKAAAAHKIGRQIKEMKEYNKKFVPGLGSNGQAIAPEKSVSGNALLRIAPQPNMNHPSDFYEVRIKSDLFTADTFIPVAFPFGPGVFNQFGISVQTGHLPTNDFLFETTDNIISSREETIFIKGNPTPVVITVYRSKSKGWVIENPVENLPNTMLTLRSGYFDRQLQGLNILCELPFVSNVKQLFKKLKDPVLTSDIVGLMGQCADSLGNIGAYQATSWIKLPRDFDRRLPQGIIAVNPRASNEEYEKGRRLPQSNRNTKQGFYNGWNTLFDKDAEASGDTLAGGGPGLNRGYWLENVLRSKEKFSFSDLRDLTVAEAVANSITAFNPITDFGADLFTPLFKETFLQVLSNQENLTSDQQATLELLTNFQGNWFEGDITTIANTDNVSDPFILASAWLLNFAGRILNPYVVGTRFEVATGTLGNPLPNTNIEGFSNNLLFSGQGNLLARLLNTNCDNTVFFPAWLQGVNVEQTILDSLNDALTSLGGFAAQPWGAGKRPIYQFKNLVLGTVATMKTFNASGLYMFAEFSPCGVKRLKAVLPLGESGAVFVGPPPTFLPMLQPHNLDQLPLFTQFQLRKLTGFKKCPD